MSLVAVFFALLLFFVVSRVSAADESASAEGRVITIHDRGTQSVIVSDAVTVGEAIEEAGISLDKSDVVEPAVSQELVAKEYEINIYRARPVTIIDGPMRQRVVTAYQTGAQIAKSAGITLYNEDVTTLAPSDDIVTDGAGLTLTIDRATLFTLTLYGTTTEVRTQGETVAQMLTEKGISIGSEDRVSVDQHTPLTTGLSVRVWREGRQTVTVDEAVAFTTEQIQSGDHQVGYKEIKTAGQTGSRNVTYEIVVQDGKETARTEIASIVTKEPVKQVEIIGVKLLLTAGYSSERVAIMTAAGISAADQPYAAYIIDHENALWCPIRWQGTSGCAASYYEKFPGAESSSQVGYGLCQATPGNKMATAGADWRTNVVTQMKWCRDYALGRYGSWLAAYNFKVARGWW